MINPPICLHLPPNPDILFLLGIYPILIVNSLSLPIYLSLLFLPTLYVNLIYNIA